MVAGSNSSSSASANRAALFTAASAALMRAAGMDLLNVIADSINIEYLQPLVLEVLDRPPFNDD